ncbi:universal stress protein [Hymenobacter aquaticus]|uniref:Universal stress protein n=1 Tax=Hymenobacter aquaticus TaxID=1867101 RepID=A0A4Z0Q1L6_9BACT|nr:universal stress protein [Hymenobacter aquaticus]TGE23877.1 universal stress protein [Hymenobacter aquaticus]
MQPCFVVFTDFTAAAETALTYTTHLARQLGGRLVLVHVYQDPLLEPEAAMVTVPLVIASRQEMLADMIQRVRQLPVPAEAELSVETLGATVAEVIERHHPLLLVLGRDKEDTLLDRLIRHQAAPVLRAAHYPLLLVPETWTDPALPQRLVVAADEQPFWLTTPALTLAPLLEQCHATTTVVHVAPHAGPSRADVALASVQRTGLFGPLTGNSLYEVCDEAPADGILHAATELQAQLIVLLARPHSVLGRLFHRSVTAQVLRRSKVPVLVLPTSA